MPSENARVDADFFAMIHQHVASVPDDSPADRRRNRRERFLGIQWVAPFDGTDFPADSEFTEVRCYDLTRSGVSFFASQRPSSEQLVIGFGHKPDLIYVAAEPIRVNPVLLFPSGRVTPIEDVQAPISRCSPTGEVGTPMMLVGCRFLRRLVWPATAPSLVEDAH
jgi:hypothetical protein